MGNVYTAADVQDAVDTVLRRSRPYPTITVLCGSTRFKDAFETVNRGLTLAGHIVVAPGVFGHADGIVLDEATKAGLDELHLRKVDLADEVYVVNPATPGQPGGYIGESTKREIAYAISVGKPIRYLVEATEVGRG